MYFKLLRKKTKTREWLNLDVQKTSMAPTPLFLPAHILDSETLEPIGCKAAPPSDADESLAEKHVTKSSFLPLKHHTRPAAVPLRPAATSNLLDKLTRIK